MEYSPKKMNDILEQNNFNFKKKFGQNFIVDENIINSIVTKSLIDKETLVIEIGPGAGSLTAKLAESSKQVLCYEIDTTLKEILNENLKQYNNVDIIYQDFLEADVINDIKKYNYNKLYIVANLPYYITTPIIINVIEKKLNVDKMVVMVQKEVGDRFKANVGTKDYNSLSIYLNYYFNVKKIMDISRNIFIPKPNVDSIVVEFTKKENNYNLKNEEIFFKLIRNSFTQKRKTIRNNLKNYDLNTIEEILKKHNQDLNTRAEQITIETFVEIANNLTTI